MGFGKTILITFAIVGIIAIAGVGYVMYGKIKSGDVQVLGTQTGNSPTGVNGQIVIPTLQQSGLIPTIDLVNCWQEGTDGKYEFDFGQMPREECLKKVEEWKAESTRKLHEAADGQTQMGDKVFNNVPTLQPMRKEDAPQINMQ
jgi:hypothetical protein